MAELRKKLGSTRLDADLLTGVPLTDNSLGASALVLTLSANNGSLSWEVPAAGTPGSGDIVITTDVAGSRSLVLSDGAGSTQTLYADTSAGLTYNTNTDMLTVNDVTISGDLTVSGDTTTVNTATLDVEDKNITIAKVTTPTDATANLGGITLKGATDKTILWTNATDTWNFNQGIKLTSGAFIGDVTGNADTATKLETARTIGGTSFDGTANIAVGLAAEATTLATPRTIGGTSFDGSANIAVALATEATNVTATDSNANAVHYPTFVDGATGAQGISTDTGFTYNPNSGILTAPYLSGSVLGAIEYTSLDNTGAGEHLRESLPWTLFNITRDIGSWAASGEMAIIVEIAKEGVAETASTGSKLMVRVSDSASGNEDFETSGTPAATATIRDGSDYDADADGTLIDGLGSATALITPVTTDLAGGVDNTGKFVFIVDGSSQAHYTITFGGGPFLSNEIFGGLHSGTSGGEVLASQFTFQAKT